MESLKHFQVQKFSGKNFQLWKYQMEIIFRSETGLFDVVNGSRSRPSNLEDQTTWDNLNAKAMLLISSGMEYEQLQTVISQTAPEMWNRLKAIHEQRSTVNKLQLKQQFFNYKMTETDSVAQHLSKIDAMAQALNDINEPVSEVDKIAKALGSLPLKYNNFITAWDSYDESKQTYDNLTARLLKEEQRLTQGEETATAFASLNVSKGQCSSQEQKESVIKRKTFDKKNMECFYCKRKGHLKSECRKRLAKLTHTQTGENKSQKHHALVIEQRNVEACNDEEDWLGDSAASRHMSHRLDWFTTFCKNDEKETAVQIGDSSCIEVEGHGTIEVLALVKGQWEPRTVEDVLYVPKLKKNLFSVGATTNKNLKVVFKDNKMEVYGKRLLAVGIKQTNQCYKMLFKTASKPQANVSTTDSIMLWHERLGHVNFKTLKEMVGNGLLSGIKTKSIDGLFCEACQNGKIHRSPFQKISKERTSKPGEVIHMDVCGKMTHSSIGGSNYFVLFKDDSTSYRLAYFLKHKSDVFSKFLEFQNLCERQTGNKVKKIKSDRGLEFNNIQFKTHCQKEGIIQEFSAPYTPEQNGRIERENRSIVEGARTMLLAAKLQPGLWAEAVNTSVYLLNRRPRELDKGIPYELWTDKKVTLKHLKRFGSEVFVHVPKQFRSKFESKAKKMVLVGYNGDSTNYRVMDPETQKITVTRDATVNERNSVKDTEENDYAVFSIKEDEAAEELTKDNCAQGNSDAEIEKKQEEENSDTSRKLRDRGKLQKPVRYEDEFLACMASINEEPQSYEEAIIANDAENWQQAMEEEISSLKINKTWSLVKLPRDAKVIDCKWIYKVKTKADGSIDKYKARLCAKGYLQRKGIDFHETFSPVVSYDSVRMLIALATEYDMYIHQFDVKTAFLHGDLLEEVYMKQPQGFVTNSSLVCKLHKSLYGLKQAPRCWNTKFVAFLKFFGFKQLETDRCVLRAEIKGELVFLALYVDDGLILCKRREVLNEILAELDKQFKITSRSADCFVGLQIKRSVERKETFVSQCSYITKMLHKFNMLNCKPIDTPADSSLVLSTRHCPENDTEKQEMEEIPYREAVGSLMFVSVVSRPDITYAVNQVSRFLNNPGKRHWIAVKRIMRYLKGTVDCGILYDGNNSTLKVYADADFANNEDNRKSISGYVSVLANAPITWSSRQQRCVARSTAEAEYVSASDAAQEVVWLRSLLSELLAKEQLSTELLIDNQSAMKLMKNTEHHRLTKHIDIKYHYIRECVENNILTPMYVPSETQLADFFN